MKRLEDRIREHLDQGNTEYQVSLDVYFEIHKWIKEQQDIVAHNLLRAQEMTEDDIETAEDLIKWIRGQQWKEGLR